MKKQIHSIPIVLALGLAFTGTSFADDKADFDPSGARKGGLAPPTPIDKMIALDTALGKNAVDWSAVWNKYQLDVNPNDYSDTAVAIPVLLGMRMSDGILAIKARDGEKLNQVASDIESLAKKLKVSDAELARAKKVRLYAGRNEWPRVFLELGYLQHDVLNTLNKDDNRDRRALLIAAGWLQGLNAISNVINDKYTETASGLLREPLLIKAILEDLDKLAPEKKTTKQATILIATLKELLPHLDVPLRSGIEQDKLKIIAKISSTACQDLLTASK